MTDLIALAERLEQVSRDGFDDDYIDVDEAAIALREAHAEIERLRALLREAHLWLSDDGMTTWRYMEGSDGFYVDRSKWLARIDAELGDRHD